MLIDMFDKQFVIYRLKNAGGRKTTFQATATVEGALQNKTIEERTTSGIVVSRNWMAYCNLGENINKGDWLVYKGKKYYVDDVAPRDYGINQHLEILLKEANE